MCCCAEWLALSAAVLLLTGGARGIRVCKEGPRFGPDVRQIKAPWFRSEDCVQPLAVIVHCTENNMVIRARADLYGTGRLVTASELRLGTDSSERNCVAVQREDTELVITAGLHECGAELRVEDDSLVYSNTLFHVPNPNRFGIIRSVGVAIPLQCRYKRTHFVSSNIQSNLESPAPTTPEFSHQYGIDDWMSLRLFDVLQSDDVSVMASVLSARHSALKLFLQRCVVTLRPNTSATPSCDLINHHGCSSDPGPADPVRPRTQSPVSFLPETDAHILRMKLDLHHSLRNKPQSESLLVTCWMKTADAVEENVSGNKVCNYMGNSWHSVDGKHEVCECCDGKYDFFSQRLMNGL